MGAGGGRLGKVYQEVLRHPRPVGAEMAVRVMHRAPLGVDEAAVARAVNRLPQRSAERSAWRVMVGGRPNLGDLRGMSRRRMEAALGMLIGNFVADAEATFEAFGDRLKEFQAAERRGAAPARLESGRSAAPEKAERRWRKRWEKGWLEGSAGAGPEGRRVLHAYPVAGGRSAAAGERAAESLGLALRLAGQRERWHAFVGRHNRAEQELVRRAMQTQLVLGLHRLGCPARAIEAALKRTPFAIGQRRVEQIIKASPLDAALRHGGRRPRAGRGDIAISE